MSKLINWSEISRLLTGDRTSIRSDYSGKKYKEVIHAIKGCETEIKAIIRQYNYETISQKSKPENNKRLEQT